jgi:hypothetical protein
MLWIVLVLFILGICGLAYFLFFYLKINPYITFITTIIVALLLLLVKRKEKIRENYRTILKEMLIVLGLSISYANAYICNSILKLDIFFVFLISIIISLLAGALIFNLTKGLMYMFLSTFLGAVIAVLVMLSPALLAGEYALVDYALLPTINSITPPFVLTLIVSIFGVILGEFLQESSW